MIVAAIVASTAPAPARQPQAGATAGTKAGDRPNVVVVMADDMRYDELGRVADLRPGGGFDRVRTHGTRFPRAWSTSNLCCPGRATYLTGQTSYNNGVFNNTPYADLENTIAVWMHDSGYCTGFTGKYLNTYSEKRPRPRGWTFWEPLTRCVWRRARLQHHAARREGRAARTVHHRRAGSREPGPAQGLTATRREHWDGRPLQSVTADPDLGHDRFLPIFVPAFGEEKTGASPRAAAYGRGATST